MRVGAIMDAHTAKRKLGVLATSSLESWHDRRYTMVWSVWWVCFFDERPGMVFMTEFHSVDTSRKDGKLQGVLLFEASRFW